VWPAARLCKVRAGHCLEAAEGPRATAAWLAINASGAQDDGRTTQSTIAGLPAADARCLHVRPGGSEPARLRPRRRRLPVLIRRRCAGGRRAVRRLENAIGRPDVGPRAGAAAPRSQKIGRRRAPRRGRPLTNGRVGGARLLAVTHPTSRAATAGPIKRLKYSFPASNDCSPFAAIEPAAVAVSVERSQHAVRCSLCGTAVHSFTARCYA